MVRRNTLERTLCATALKFYCLWAGHDGCFCHFVPRAFDKSAAELLDLPSAEPRSRLAVVRTIALHRGSNGSDAAPKLKRQSGWAAHRMPTSTARPAASKCR